MKKIIAELIKKGNKLLAVKVRKVEARGLTYDGTGKKKRFGGKITIPILGEIIEELYVDKESGKESGARVYKINYDKSKMQDALDKVLFNYFKKENPGLTWPKKYNGPGDRATIGFAQEWHNQEKEDNL